MPATIVDVARRAGVSIATVSRVIHHSLLVNETTRARVQQAIAELNYAPNAVARGLVTRRTQAIGLVITSMADPFFPPLVDGVEEEALNHGFSVLLCTSNNDPAREMALVRLLKERRVDAIIVAASRVGSLYHEHLQEIKVPLVLINNEQSGAYTHTIGSDDVAGGRLATSYLIGLGHRRIAYLHGPLSKQSNHDRFRGYEAALHENGLAPAAGLTVSGDGLAEGAQRAMAMLLRREPPPTAVVCFNDLTAIGALRAVHAAGLAVPASMSVIGYDDIYLAAYIEPPLTTIAQETRELGQRALAMALDLLAGRETPSVLLPPRLVERMSCAVLRSHT